MTNTEIPPDTSLHEVSLLKESIDVEILSRVVQRNNKIHSKFCDAAILLMPFLSELSKTTPDEKFQKGYDLMLHALKDTYEAIKEDTEAKE